MTVSNFQFVCCESLDKKKQPPPGDTPSKPALPVQAKDAERIRDFIMEHRPHVVLVGGANPVCRQLVAVLNGVRDHILEHFAKFLTTRCGPSGRGA